jgi:hypothetical protein
MKFTLPSVQGGEAPGVEGGSAGGRFRSGAPLDQSPISLIGPNVYDHPDLLHRPGIRLSSASSWESSVRVDVGAVFCRLIPPCLVGAEG